MPLNQGLDARASTPIGVRKTEKRWAFKTMHNHLKGSDLKPFKNETERAGPVEACWQHRRPGRFGTATATAGTNQDWSHFNQISEAPFCFFWRPSLLSALEKAKKVLFFSRGCQAKKSCPVGNANCRIQAALHTAELYSQNDKGV